MRSSHTGNEHKIDNLNHCDIIETPVYPVVDALTHLSDKPTQKLVQHPISSPLKIPFSGGRLHVHTIPPRLTLPFKQKLLQASEAHSLNISSTIKERWDHIAIQHTHLMPVAEESISSFDTALMFAVRPGEVTWQQQDILINSMIEDISRQVTLQLPAIGLTSEQQASSNQRQVIASTSSSAAIAGAGDLISAVLKYVTNVVMTNFVSQSVFGTYVTTYTSVTVVGFIAALGLNNTMVRFLSMYRAKGEHGLATGLIRFVMSMTLISGLLCGTLFYLAATVLAHLVYHQDVYIIPFKEAALLVPLIALQLVLSSGLQALKAIKWKVYVDRLIQPGLPLVLVGVFYALGMRLEALILATTCGLLASVITGHVLLRKSSKPFVRDAVPRFERKTWLRFALPMSFSSLIQNVLNSTDVLFLTAFATAAQVGLYAAADRVSILILMPLLALNVIFSPLIAEYHGRGEHEQLANLSRLVTKWSFSLSLPVFLCFCIFHDAILGIFSKGYTAAGMVLMILSFGNRLVYLSFAKISSRVEL